MAVSHIANASVGATGTAVTSLTTTGVDTTGATLIILAVEGSNTTTLTVSDSKGNTWTQIDTSGIPANSLNVVGYYCVNPVVGTGHTFSMATSGTSHFPMIAMDAWSGITNATPLDKHGTATNTTGTTIQPGSLTPTQNNELVYNFVVDTGSTSRSISAGTITNTANFVSGQHQGYASAWLQQSTAAATNPTWTFSGSLGKTALQATFFSDSADTGSLALTQGASTINVQGLAGVLGSLALTQAKNSSAISALAGIISSIAVTQGADTISVHGLAGVLGSLGLTQGASTIAISGKAGVIASLALQQGNSLIAIAAKDQVVASIIVSQQPSTISIHVSSPPTGSLALTQGGNQIIIRGFAQQSIGRRRNTSFPNVVEVSSNDVEHRRQIARVVNTAMAGKINAVSSITLTASAASTTLTDARIGPLSYIQLQPLTANAAAELASGNVYIPATTQIQGSAVIQHSNNSETDRAFNVLIIG